MEKFYHPDIAELIAELNEVRAQGQGVPEHAVIQLFLAAFYLNHLSEHCSGFEPVALQAE